MGNGKKGTILRNTEEVESKSIIPNWPRKGKKMNKRGIQWFAEEDLTIGSLEKHVCAHKFM